MGCICTNICSGCRPAPSLQKFSLAKDENAAKSTDCSATQLLWAAAMHFSKLCIHTHCRLWESEKELEPGLRAVLTQLSTGVPFKQLRAEFVYLYALVVLHEEQAYVGCCGMGPRFGY